MSYAGSRPFLGIEPWERVVAETDEVYLWRATLLGADIRGISDVQAIAAAIGRNQGLGLDLRGVAVESTGSGNTYDVDAAFTSKAQMVYVPGQATAEDIAQRVATELEARFAGVAVRGARFEQITDDAPKHPALDFWLYHSIIWDIPSGVLFPTLEKGNPTHAFARFEGLYRGKAEQGASLKKWPEDRPPGSGANGVNESSVLPFVLLAGSAALVAYLVYQRTDRKGAAT